MGKLLQIVQLGHSILRQKAKTVTNIKDRQIQVLIDDLIATVMDVEGVGIAAPQVYQSVKVFIVASHPNPRYPNAPKMEPTAMINPKLLRYNKVKHKDWEGCLSIPGIRGLIPRYTTVKFEYTDRTGKLVRTEYANDFLARIFQHELDHLKGTVFLDRLESNKDIITEKEYQRLVSTKSTKTSK